MIISINDIKKEMKLKDDIYTKLGGVLFKKGTSLSLSDIKIFEAFEIKQIDVIDEEIDTNKYIKKEEMDNDDINEYQRLFNQAIKVLDRIFISVQGNAQIPVMNLRKALQPLFKDEYISPRYLFSLKYTSLDYKRYDSKHALTVGILSYAIAVWMNLEQGERMQIAIAGTLHDIGMSRIPNSILYKKGDLTTEEIIEIRNHSLYGYQILKDTKGLNEGSILGVLQHHEREDGKGYPLKLKGNQIHQYAKIIAIADVFNAMTSEKKYRGEYYPFQALDELSNDENSRLDLEIINIFSTRMIQLENGTKVLLSNDQEGSIAHINQQYPTRPIIKINDSLLNLINEKKIYVKKVY